MQSNKTSAERLQVVVEAIRDGKAGELGATGPTPDNFGPGTPNQAALWVTVYCVEAGLGLAGTSRATAIKLANLFFDAQDKGLYGLRPDGGDETLSPSHGQYWDSVFAGMFLAAILIDDDALYARALKCLRSLLAVLHLCSYINPKNKTFAVAAPGVRGVQPTKDTAANSATDLLYHTARSGKIWRANEDLWGDRYNTGPIILRYLMKSEPKHFARLQARGIGTPLRGVGAKNGGEPQAGPWTVADLPVFAEPMLVQRSQRGHVAWFPVLHGLEVQHAMWCIDGKVGLIGWSVKHKDTVTKWGGGPIPEEPPQLEDAVAVIVGPGA